MRFFLLTLVPGILIAGCATTSSNQRAPQEPAAACHNPQMPPFPLAAVKGPHAKSAKLYMNADGTFRKYTVYVDRAGIPDWVHAMADKELGQGEETDFEVEQYENGETVYEVTRRIEGKRIELSVLSTTRQKLYIERQDQALDSIPATIKAAAEAIEGFTTEGYSLKQLSKETIHKLSGQIDGREVHLYLTQDGKLKERRIMLPARLAIER